MRFSNSTVSNPLLPPARMGRQYRAAGLSTQAGQWKKKIESTMAIFQRFRREFWFVNELLAPTYR